MSSLLYTLEIPFELRGNQGQINVSLSENNDPIKCGFDIIGLPKEAFAGIKGFPVCTAKISYSEEGYKSWMGWVQSVS